MPYLFTVTTQASREQVLAAFARRGPQRPVPIPHDVARLGIKGVTCSVRGGRFKILPHTTDEFGSGYELVGSVEEMEGGSTQVSTVVRVADPWIAPLVLLLMAGAAVAASSFWSLLFVAAAAAIHLRDRAKDRSVSPETCPEARYLVDSLTAILTQQFGAPASVSPAYAAP
ncbi:MAG TPA: hypothetical protein VFH27_10260 [Longimicrobiaceae bacterium]|nr:hypothetical protein [Longimicrobiaceae bacterium]